jgi:hypothetical protein
VNAVADGELQTVAVLRRGDTVFTHVAFLPGSVDLSYSTDSNTARPDIARELSVPLLVSTLMGGRVLGFRPSADLSATTRNLWRALLSLRQIVWPDSAFPSARQWTVEENDPAGQYLATYTAETSVRHLLILTKRKTAYLEPPQRRSASARMVAPTFLSRGRSRAAYSGRAPGPDTLVVADTLNTFLSGRAVSSSATSLSVTFARSTRVEQAELAALRANAEHLYETAPMLSLSSALTDEQTELALARSHASVASISDLVALLRKLDAAGGQAVATTPLFLRLRAQLVLHPEQADSVDPALVKAKRGSPSFRTLIAALASAGTSRAQTLIVKELVSRAGESESVRAIASALIAVRFPTRETVLALLALTNQMPDDDRRTAVLLALGSVSRVLGETSPALADSVIRSLAERLSSASSPRARREYLHALGNAGSDAALPELRTALADSNVATRAAAAYALRWLTAPPVNAVLSDVLRSDPASAVRQAVISALAARGDRSLTVPQVRALQYAADTDLSEEVRSAARRLLADRQSTEAQRRPRFDLTLHPERIQ